MTARSKNSKLRKQEYQYDYTAEQIQEIRKSINDPIYFIETYVRIQHPSRGAVNFKLYDYQKELIELYSSPEDSIVLSARQTGKCFFYKGFLETIQLGGLKKTFRHSIIYNIKKFILFIIDRRVYYDTFGKVR